MHFVPSETMLAGPAAAWPRLSIVADQGSDNTCAVSFLGRHLGANVVADWDPSHGCHNDVLAGVRYAMLTGHLVLSLVRLNILSGPWQEDVWYKRILQVLSEVFQSESPDGCEVFDSTYEEMLEEEGGKDIRDCQDARQRMWDRLREANPCANKGAKVVMGRFFNVIRKMREHTKVWAQITFCYLALALEMGLFNTNKMTTIKIGAIAETKGTSAAKETEDEKALRRACANNFMVATVLVCDDDVRRRDRLICSAAAQADKWHGLQNSRLRSVSSVIVWLQKHLRGDFTQHLKDTLNVIRSEPELEACEFLLPKTPATLRLCHDDTLRDREDAFALTYIELIFGTIFSRIRRCTGMLLSWSSRSSLFW